MQAMVDLPPEVETNMMKSEVNLVNYKAVDPTLEGSIRKSTRISDPKAFI